MVLAMWWGPRVVVGTYLAGVLCAHWWGVPWQWAPLYALPAALQVGLAWLLFVRYGGGQCWLPSLDSLIRFLFFALLVPVVVTNACVESQLHLLGKGASASWWNVLMILVTADLASHIALAVPVLVFVTALMQRRGWALVAGQADPAVILAADQRTLLDAFCIGAVGLFLLLLPLLVNVQYAWLLYGVLVMVLALRYGMPLAIMGTSWTVLAAVLVPTVLRRHGGETASLSSAAFEQSLNTFLLCSLSLLAGRTISDMAGEISRRREIEAALRESERKTRAVFDLAFELMGVLKPSGMIVEANRTSLEAVGLQLTDIVGKSFWDTPWWRHSEDARQRVREAVQKAAGGALTRFEETYVSRGDVIGVLDMSLKPVQDDAGHVVMLIVEGRDITDRRRTEDELRRQTAVTNTLIEASPVFFISIGAEGKTRRINPAMLTALGYSADEVVGKDYLGLLIPAEERELLAGVFDQIVTRRQHTISENHVRRKDGRLLLVEWHGVPIFDGDRFDYLIGVGIDVTERKQAGELLRTREQRLQRQNAALLALMSRGTLFQTELQQAIAGITEACADLVETERVSVWLYSEDCSTIRCIDLFRRSRREHTASEELVSKEFQAYVACHREGKVVAATDVYTDPRVKQIPASYFQEHGIRALLDAPVWLQGRLGAILSFEHVGEPRSWTGEDERLAADMATLLSLCFETHERRRAEQALLASELSYRQLFDAFGDAFLVHDAETGQILDVNQTMLNMFGFSREEAVSMRISDISEGVPPYSQAEAVQHVRTTMTEGPQVFDWRSRRKDGQLFWTEVSLCRCTLGGQVRILASVRDVGQRKRMEDELRESEERLKLALEVQGAGIWEMDLKTGRVSMDPRVCEQLGFAFGEEPKTVEELRKLVHPEDAPRARASFAAYLRGEASSYEAETRTRRVDGSYTWSYTKGRITEREADGTPRRLLGTSVNIDARKRAEEGIRRLNAELEERVAQRTAQLAAANASLNEFAYAVSHDLKAPLRAVSQLAHWISEDYKAVIDDEGRSRLSLMNARITRMYNLIEGILEYSRIGRVEEDRQSVDLDAVVRETIDALAPPPHIRVTVEGTLPVITTSRPRMQQLFQNLIGNAIKYMDKPEGLITVGCDDFGDFWRFRVTDNGPGIDAKYHEKVFGIFQTLATRGQPESTGIGLALVKKIVEGYGGRVDLQSEVGKGSTFSFTLPK
jgi:PAS domain S-box-containing protein